MYVEKILILLTVCAFMHATSTKENHGQYLEKKHHTKHTHRKAIVHHGLHVTHRHNNVKKIKEKNFPDRCQIICPIIPSPPENCYGNALYPGLVTKPTPHPQTTRSTTPEDSTEDESSEESTESSEEDTSLPPNNATKSVIKPQNKIKNRIIRIGTSKKTRRHQITYHRLSKVQQKLLLKKLKLANRHGKKAYKFRNFNEFYCTIECGEECEHQPYIELPQDGDEDDSDSDSYEEGEDTPIEATFKPGAPDTDTLNGIKPFGPVDFMGFDDFGPNGELALDPYSIYEGKANVKHRKARKGRKNV